MPRHATRALQKLSYIADYDANEIAARSDISPSAAMQGGYAAGGSRVSGRADRRAAPRRPTRQQSP